jgi:ATP sulfurylase
MSKCQCFYYKPKIVKLYNKLEETICDSTNFIPISHHQKIIKLIYHIEDLWFCNNTENCETYAEINRKRTKIIDINGTKIKLFLLVSSSKINHRR